MEECVRGDSFYFYIESVSVSAQLLMRNVAAMGGCCCVSHRAYTDSCRSHNISWKLLASKSNCLFCSRYMHAALVMNNTIYVHGGISSEDTTDRIFIRYQNRKWERVPVISKVQPLCLYGHSMAYDSKNNELVLFGDIICGSSSFKAANDFIWKYNLETIIGFSTKILFQDLLLDIQYLFTTI